jgi:LPPG:FO 2-phospho-L-lactate transferase
VSIDPILSIPDIHTALEGKVVIAVSPIISGQTIKGPAAKIFSELGIKPSALAVAQHYGSLIRCLCIDNSDTNIGKEINALGICTYVTDIVMHDRLDRGRLASEIVEYIKGINR